jgi:hypothetical protein
VGFESTVFAGTDWFNVKFGINKSKRYNIPKSKLHCIRYLVQGTWIYIPLGGSNPSTKYGEVLEV